MSWGRVALVCVLAAACTKPSSNREARLEYNKALEALAAKKWADAARGFLAARDKAGPDPELRYRAAFNLGLAKASEADALSKEEPAKAIELLRDAADWFFDALGKRPRDADAEHNLELVLRRIEVLADALNKGKNTLASKLSLLIENQRALLDQVRQLMSQVAAQGAKADPVAFETPFRLLAVRERELMSDATDASNLAAEQRAKIEKTPADKRSDQDKGKMFQLERFDVHMQKARAAMAETRRLLRRLQGDNGHARADAALTALKRAHAQLLPPEAVLRGLLQDQAVLLQHTQALAAVTAGLVKTKQGTPAKAPPWLTPALLGVRQKAITERVDEVLSHLLAIASAPDQPPEPKQDPNSKGKQGSQPKKPSAAELAQRKRYIESARSAANFVQTAVARLRDAKEGLDATPAKLPASVENMAKGIDVLRQAIEQFADLRALIELAYADQAKAVQLVTPPADPKKQPPLLAKLTPADRIEVVAKLAGENNGRLTRLAPLLKEGLQAAQAKLAAAVKGNDPAKTKGTTPKPQAKDDPKAQAEAEVKRFTEAERLRGEAQAALAELDTALTKWKAATSDKAKAAVKLSEPAKLGLDKLAELRKLFFNLIEHLRELVRAQSETLDKTVRAHQATGKDRLEKLGPLAEYQDGHAKLAQPIAAALGEQADQLAKTMDKKQRDYGKKVAEAAAEVTSATGKMNDATQLLREAREKSATSSYDLKPTLEHQRQAIAHLSRALELLQQKQNKDDKKQNQDMSQRQAQSKLQKARDDEAKRFKQRGGGKREPVEKDW